MSSFALALSVMFALTEIFDNERIVLQQNTAIVWQVPTILRERIQVVVYVSRSLSDQLSNVDLSTVVLELQHVTAFSLSLIRMCAPS